MNTLVAVVVVLPEPNCVTFALLEKIPETPMYKLAKLLTGIIDERLIWREVEAWADAWADAEVIRSYQIGIFRQLIEGKFEYIGKILLENVSGDWKVHETCVIPIQQTVEA